jgi:hypothetical protein
MEKRKRFFILKKIQTLSGAHPASYSAGKGKGKFHHKTGL